MQFRSLGWEDRLEEEGMETRSSMLAWRIPMDRGAWRATVHSVAKESDTTKGTQHSVEGRIRSLPLKDVSIVIPGVSELVAFRGNVADGIRTPHLLTQSRLFRGIQCHPRGPDRWRRQAGI